MISDQRIGSLKFRIGHSLQFTGESSSRFLIHTQKDSSICIAGLEMKPDAVDRPGTDIGSTATCSIFHDKP